MRIQKKERVRLEIRFIEIEIRLANIFSNVWEKENSFIP